MYSVSAFDKAKYYKYLARLNYEAALAADKVIGFLPGYEIAAPPPVMMLCAHCIELSLKAYLLDRGLSASDVRNIGHNLLQGWERCAEMGAAGPRSREVLEYISDLLVSGRLKYGDKSKLGIVPVFGPLTELCEAALSLCGAPSAADLSKGV